jgi:hypothetical protein
MAKTRCQELTRAMARGLYFALGVAVQVLDWGRAMLLTGAHRLQRPPPDDRPTDVSENLCDKFKDL